jgi:branched-chain amino acid transport system ATP-binding protein
VTAPVLELRDLHAEFGSRIVLRRCSFAVGPGEVSAVIGLNGAGKTVLLRTAAGFVPRATGRVLVDGTDLSGLRPEHRVRAGLVLVPQERRIIAGLTIEENLRLGAFRLHPHRYNDVLARILDLFPIFAERLGQQADILSRGELTLLALARGLMSQPKVVLFDEPFGGLSSGATSALADTMQGLGRNGKTFLFTDQDRNRAALAAKRFLPLRDGTIEK